MNRRKFQKNIVATALIAPFLMSSTEATARKKKYPKRIIKPPRLKKGATIGLIAPSSPLPDGRWEKCISNLEGMGFKLKYDKENIDAKYGYLAGKDEIRANTVNKMFADSEIDAIWCVRGGYGAARILPMLDYKMIKQNPKIIIGYSDITALLQGIFLKTGLVGFHGPVASSTYTDYTLGHTLDVLMKTEDNHVINHAAENLASKNHLYQPATIVNGSGVGELIGGNLTLVTSLMGTPYELDTKGKIIFLEDIGEKPYRIDRMLTQLLLAGKFDEVAGVALGVFDDCEKGKNDTSLSLMEVIKDRLGSLNVPVVYGLSFGHITNQCTLPIGIKAKLDAEAQRLTLLESAVV